MRNSSIELSIMPNKRIPLTVKSVTFFAKQKNAPLFTSADAGVIHATPLSLRGTDNTELS